MQLFEAWLKGIDTTFIGIEYALSSVRYYHLCPYSSETIREATSHENTKKRIKLIDSAILKCMKVN